MTLPRLAIAQSGYGGRGYKNPVTEDRRIVPSITTVLKAENKPAIAQWTADQTAGYAVANAERLLTQSEDWGFKHLRWYYKREASIEGDGLNIRDWAGGVRDDAADMGTAIHEWIQADLVPELPFPDLDAQGEPFWQMVERWEQWKAGKEIIPHRTEASVWNDEAGYAGTLDGVWEIDGKYCLMDIKSSRGLYTSTWMQLAALFYAPEMFVPQDDDTYAAIRDWQAPVEEIGVLHIRPNDSDSRGNDMPSFCKWVPMPGDRVLHYKAFEGLLQYQHAQRELRLLEREMEKNGA